MPKRSSKLDINQSAFNTLQQVTGELATDEKQTVATTLNDADIRRRIMQEMGRRGGKKGGKARAAKLSKSRRSEIAKRAAAKRWSRPKKVSK